MTNSWAVNWLNWLKLSSPWGVVIGQEQERCRGSWKPSNWRSMDRQVRARTSIEAYRLCLISVAASALSAHFSWQGGSIMRASVIASLAGPCTTL
jgi:hypothetical protein